MVSSIYLVFDFGASNGRCIVAEYNGKKICVEVVHRFINKPVYAAGTLYTDILRLFSELKNGISLASERFNSIVSMGIDTWASDFGFIDINGKLIANPIHYRDQSRHTMADDLYKIVPEIEIFNLTGGNINSTLGLYNLYSLKQKNSTEILYAYKLLMIPDILNYFLTGETYSEFTNATTTLLYNQKDNKWENKILKKINVSANIFNQIVIPGTELGVLTDDLKSELGTGSVKVIAPATHDTASAVAGIPVMDRNKNWAFISIGTWYVIGIENDCPVINNEVFNSGFCNQGGVEGLNLLFKAVTGLWIIQQCRERWIKEKCVNVAWDEINEMSLKSTPFKTFIDINDNIFLKPQSDMPGTIVNYCKDKGLKVPENMQEISRCIYESIVMSIKSNFSMLEKLIDKKIEIVQIIGGGTQNRIFCEWIGDALGIPVVIGPVETTSMGNLIMQLKAAGEIGSLEEGRELSLNSSTVIYYEPDKKNKDKWDGAFNRYVKIL
ncbi:MAG: rhamnulokinase [Actinobacteria bacterium]|nr:rhamnulokinase [Actinomycetota bacterium]